MVYIDQICAFDIQIVRRLKVDLKNVQNFKSAWMEAWLPGILLLQILHTQTGPGLVSMPALINRSLMVAAEILPSLVKLVKNPCQRKRRFLCLVYHKKE